MSLNTEAVENLVKYINHAIDYKANKLQYDKTIIAKVIRLIEGKKYEVEYSGNLYSTFALNNNLYMSGDKVLVMFLEGSYENSFIIDKL